MDPKRLQRGNKELWGLVRRQHGVVARSQLLELGFGSDSIKHRIARGRLHPLWRGVYAVGRREVSQHGRWMAAVLSCGPKALLSHRSAAALWGLLRSPSAIEVVIPADVYRRRPGIRVHRRARLDPTEWAVVDGIPLTNPACTLVDIASLVPEWQLERAINEADRLDLIDPEALRAAIEPLSRRPGLTRLRTLLDRHTFTDSGLERRFLSLARSAGLQAPQAQARVNGFRVDFYWPDLGLVVETDGLRYHRTPGQQARDHQRDQAHAAAGLTTLRFAEAQVRNEPDRVRETLVAVTDRLRAQAGLRPERSRL
jgi:very-short-patch-repair endonuclease